MSTRSVTLVRHGHRQDFVEESWAPHWGETAEFPNDPDLSDRGVREAEAVAQKLVGANATILSSPFLRTVHTASHIAKACGRKVDIEPGLHEMLSPDWFAEAPSVRPFETLQARFGNLNGSYTPCFGFNFPESTMGDVVQRMRRVFPGLLKHVDGDLILVTHADPIVAVLISAGIASWRTPIRSASIYRIEGAGDSWELTTDEAWAHLSA